MMKRVGIKQQPWLRDAAARRRDTMQQQRQARRDLAAHARRLAGGEESEAVTESETEGMADIETKQLSKKKTREERVKRRREHFNKQLMIPEWMGDVPLDLNGKGSTMGEGWYVVPRPEGKRCLVVTNSGVTIARTQSGSIFKKFPSALPNGSRKTTASTEAYCILDCIFHGHDSTFYVLDVMCWKGYLLYNCTTEFRWYWLRDKLAEGNAGEYSSSNPCRFLPLPCYECDEQGILDAYNTTFPFIKDGLLFYTKAAHYELGLTPLVVLWKDAMTSRYYQSTTDRPNIILRLDGDRHFSTLEGVVLLTAEQPFLDENELTEGDLVKFSFDPRYFGHDTNPHLLGLALTSRCSPQRALADSWTKIVFQYYALSGGIPINQLIEAARDGPVIDASMES
ncbi:hypothetical protein Poli38472_000370 [Pythium oligandrum]|uniref:Snurportin-1 n=1 Tax=Pythium oligandrum TaxID=41045 RepID=A0A8K1FJ26_PYTOL|nr:hypothetical protein Poli38472_000370 [Pythium oligandrum]|eukprot:TMW60328.1 hypothetical protein Poli38472_000370 [Pythium oligandrum]